MASARDIPEAPAHIGRIGQAFHDGHRYRATYVTLQGLSRHFWCATLAIEMGHPEAVQEAPKLVEFSSRPIRPIRDVIRDYTLAAVEANAGKEPQYMIAVHLGISPTTLIRQLKKWRAGA